MTYRDRREAKAERLREWAEKREAKAAVSFDTARGIGDAIPMGQPILVGHHSERRHRRDIDRIDRSMGAGVEHTRKAEDFKSRAGNIEATLERSIYSDDPDAIEALEARIADLEAQRDRIKRFNATCRKGSPDFSILTGSEKQDLLTVARVAAYSLSKGGGFPAYKLSNLNGNLSRNRKRLEALKREAD